MIDIAIEGGKEFPFLPFEESTVSFPLGKIVVSIFLVWYLVVFFCKFVCLTFRFLAFKIKPNVVIVMFFVVSLFPRKGGGCHVLNCFSKDCIDFEHVLVAIACSCTNLF